MIIVIAPGLIVALVAVAVLVALAHLTAGTLIILAAILAGCVVLTACAVAVMHGRVMPSIASRGARYRAEVIGRAEEPAWTAEPVSDAPTRAQLEAAFRYMASVYGNVPPLANLEAIDPPRKEDT